LFTSVCTNLGCSFDGSGSSDPDGTVASYAWDFGDGTSGVGVTPSHTYATAGAYTVVLTVTDNLGQTAQVSHGVTVAAPANVAPTALFTSVCTNLGCSFDGSGSSDPDGTVASYAWDFGDGTSGTGSAPSYIYLAAGSYTVVLTVTDDLGQTAQVSHVVTVT
jgi:PKD repeat protein